MLVANKTCLKYDRCPNNEILGVQCSNFQGKIFDIFKLTDRTFRLMVQLSSSTENNKRFNYQIFESN